MPDDEILMQAPPMPAYQRIRGVTYIPDGRGLVRVARGMVAVLRTYGYTDPPADVGYSAPNSAQVAEIPATSIALPAELLPPVELPQPTVPADGQPG